MLLETLQFGAVEIAEENIIRFPKGLLGFEALEKYAILDNPDFHPFRWLQCIDSSDLAFVIVSPVIFFPDYRVAVHAKEVADIGVKNPRDVEIHVIVTIPPQFERMSADLQGPILINTKTNLAKQLVLANSEYGVQHPIFDELTKLTPHPSRSSTVVELTR